MAEQFEQGFDVYTNRESQGQPAGSAAGAPGPAAGPSPVAGDWWRFQRGGPVSGLYAGEMTEPLPGRASLELRVDVDPRYRNSPVMDRVSGDLYQLNRLVLPGRPPRTWRVYRESWIVDQPEVRWSRSSVEITGTVRFWKGSNPATTVHVRIPWGGLEPAGPAEVTFEAGTRTRRFACARRSDCFRELNLEVDVCESVNSPPLLPSYETSAHPTRPTDLPARTLTVEEAYREAGVLLTVRPAHTVIGDTNPQFESWSPAELHHAMEEHFSQIRRPWPAWEMWGVMAGRFDAAGVGGIMFDAADAFGGAGVPPERQGFAVFRSHPWFEHLRPTPPASEDEARAMRHFLYTFVHEAGHAFNLLHSWDKGRPNSLSWMNYDWKYDANNGDDAFWSRFRFRFDDEELIHLRHGDRAAVMMGGDPWASGGHLESPPESMALVEGTPPLELLLRAQPVFDFMEPVSIEIRLRNQLDDTPVEIDTRLHPDSGNIVLFIRRPDGRTLEYAPIMCKVGIPDPKVLTPQGGVVGLDRHSENVFVGYGTYGFYFDEPGEYLVRAVYHGAGSMLIPSNVLRVRVTSPASKAEDRLAQDFFTYEVGMSLYLGGSRSPHLAKGMDRLAAVAEEYSSAPLGAKVSASIGRSFARPFFAVEKGKLVKTHDADLQRALEITAPAVELFRRDGERYNNLPYRYLVADRTDYLRRLGRAGDALNELTALEADLAQRGVNPPVLESVEADAQATRRLAA
jgi:hypothetical protein